MSRLTKEELAVIKDRVGGKRYHVQTHQPIFNPLGMIFEFDMKMVNPPKVDDKIRWEGHEVYNGVSLHGMVFTILKIVEI